MDWQTRDRQVLWHPFTQHDEWDRLPMLCIERGEGMYLIDTDGKRYLDGVSSLWCNLFGHRHPRLDAAVRAQLERIAHSTLLGLSHPNAVVLAEKLVAAAAPLGGGLRRVFYSDSGSTATEVALKMAFQAQQQRGQRQRIRFAALSEAYHGDTLGAVGVGGIPLFHQVYQPLLTQALRIPAPERPDPVEEAACLREAEALFAAHGEQVAAFIFEPLVQGAAGMRMHSPGWLRRLCTLAKEAGILLIADEVATGFGRTGSLFAMEQVGVEPDLLCVAKGLTGGYLPLAATLASEAVFSAFRGPYAENRTLFHGHTYTGNPLACAAAIATLELLEEEAVIAQLPAKAAILAEAMAGLRHPWIQERRQCGMMAAFVLGPEEGAWKAADRIGLRVCYEARKAGAVVRNLGDAIVLMPPLAMEEPELRRMVAAVGEGIAAVAAG